MKKSFLSQLMLIVLSICTMSVKAETLTVTYNTSSGISDANCIGTLSDGTILGFYLYSYDSYAYFCGAIASTNSIEVPDKIAYNNKEYNVVLCGYYLSHYLDFDEATSVTSLTLPSTITNISSVPSSVSDLHLKSTTPPSLHDSSSIPNSTTVWVSQSAFASYQSVVTNSDSYWYGKYVHYEGWEPKSYSINVQTPGTFAQVLLGVIEQWTDVDELTVSGNLNESDLAYLSRLKYMIKLDLSQTNITTITGCAGLNYLKTILLPSSVKSVAKEAFKNCSLLREISLPNTAEIGSSAFYSCSSLTSVSLPAATSIGDYAFRNCSSLTSVSLPAATSIGDFAFDYCYSLSTVSLPAATNIGSDAFDDCYSLSTVSLPAATNIGSYAFCYCSSLSTVSLPAATNIGSSAFSSCYSLSTVSLPAATNIGSSAFSSCSSLSTVSLPAATNIGSSAFRSCSSLSTVSLPNTLTSLGGNAFENCKNLTDVYCYVISPLTTTAFSSTGASMTTLHVPAFAMNAYILHDNWYTFYKIVPIEESIDKVIISSDFTITDYTGLAEKVDLSVLSTYDNSNYNNTYAAGHLTVSAKEKLNIGDYLQFQGNRSYDYYYDDDDNRVYMYMFNNSTVIPYNEMSADNITVKYSAQVNRWNFISFPFDVNVSDIQCPEGTLWVIRKYSGEDRANMTGNTWQNMTDGMTLKAGEGYILHCNDGSNSTSNYVEFTFKAVNNDNKNNIFAYQDVTKPLSTYASDLAHNRSWNLVGNPYPCFYDTRNIEHNGVITVWNGNGYTACSLLDDNYVLRPHESFFVQCPNDASSMTFKANGRQHTYEASNNVYNSKLMKFANTDSRHVYNLTLSGNEYTDKARVVINDAAKIDYEISCDASKFMSSNNAVPQLYVLENGQRFAIDERPLADGIIALGAYFGQAGDYTIALPEYTANGVNVFLTDKQTMTTVDLTRESYKFSANQGTNDARFVLSFTNDPNGIESIINSVSNWNDKIYNLKGQKLNAPQKGINIINGNKTLVK